MRRNQYGSIPALLLTAVAMIFIAATSRTNAQQSVSCCTYTVIIHGFTSLCGQLPIPVSIVWGCTPVVITTTNYYGNGTFIEPIGNPPLTPCPPACPMLAISLDGVTYIQPGHNGNFSAGGCCYHASTGFDQNGCVVIKISPC